MAVAERVTPAWASGLSWSEREAVVELLAAREAVLKAQRACVVAGCDGQAVYGGVQGALEGLVQAIGAMRGL